jgi:parallel beta-helix repeat protein
MKTNKNLLNSKVAYLLILTILISSLVTPLPFEASAAGATIYVPDDYSTIQDAIGNATAGDTIIVKSGHTNYGPIMVNKQLTIQGQNQYACIIDAMGSSDAVSIYANNVVFKRFTVGNCTDDGVYVNNGNATLDTLIISDCGDEGVYLSSSSDNSTIKYCEIHDCEDRGIYFYNSDNSIIDNCIINDCNYGAYIYRSFNSTIKNSEAYNMVNDGIYLSRLKSCSVSDSETHHCYRGIYSYITSDVNINGCELFNNTYQGIYAETSERFNVFDCDIYYNSGYEGIYTVDCNQGSVLASRIYDNAGRGINVYSSDLFTVAQCEIYKNNWQGIYIQNSDLTSVDSCRVYDHLDSNGVYISLSDHCWVKNCTIYNNSDGIYVSSSDIFSICDSQFYDNNDDGVDVWTSPRLYMTGSSFLNNDDEGLEIDYSQGVAVNCNFSGNHRGVEAVSTAFRSRYCSFEDNIDLGVYADFLCIFNASDCWWGNMTGPYHYSNNPTGTGDQVSDYVEFEPWQTQLYQPDTLISGFRCGLDELNWRVIYPDDETPKPLGCVAASVSDWLASAFVTTKLPGYVEGLDTNASFVDQSTGEAVGDPDSGIITFGGPFVNPIVKRAEDDATAIVDRAPVKFYNGGDTFYFQYANGTNIPGAELPLSVINVDEDLFVIETYTDGDGRLMMICYGFGWPGTYAAGKFFDTAVFPHLASFTDGWVIVHWDDTNSDSFVNEPGEGDTYSIVAVGN